MSQDKPTDSEAKSSVSRRNLFHVLGAVPAMAAVTAGSLAAQHDHSAMAHGSKTAAPKGPYQRKIFDEAQWRTASVLSDLIIPADERSGSATQAGVPEFIDDWIHFRKENDGDNNLEAQILGGFTWLDRESNRLFQANFSDADQAQQKQILDRIAWPDRAAAEDKSWVKFFSRFRDLTVSGFFSSKMGVKDLNYLGNTAIAEWKGVDPKAWAIVEERMKNGYKGVAIMDVKPWGA